MLQIVTSAVNSISMKSLFARAVVGTEGVVTHSINITTVCFVGTLVNIEHNKKGLFWNICIVMSLRIVIIFLQQQWLI